MQMEQWQFDDWELALEHYFREGIRHKQFPAGKVAVNAVMAGCPPEHFPVVAAALSASSCSTKAPANFSVSGF